MTLLGAIPSVPALRDEIDLNSKEGPLGATPDRNGTWFRVWSTNAAAVEVHLFRDGETEQAHVKMPLRASGDGLFTGRVEGVGTGTLYKFSLDGKLFPDPYARFLPYGVHGPARVDAVKATAPLQPAISLERCVLYEIHVGTFTTEGTFKAAATRLPALAELGVTAIELMPLSAFPGTRGWGYDGVAHFAPFAPYGEPDDLRSFIEVAHGLGLAVILDVVYNHFGPAGNYLRAYSDEYFCSDIKTAWGDAPNFRHARVRAYALDNARYWLEEYGFDGLRLDATHEIVDHSSPHVLEEIARMAHSLAVPRLVFAEDDRNEPALVKEKGLDGIWADDFHHGVRVTLTGERDGYFAAYRPGLNHLARTVERGWLYEGQLYPLTRCRRGGSADALAVSQLLYCIQNHDQVGNRALGSRLHHDVSVEHYAVASMLLLFLPMTPLLFMGQEWASSSPFLYFTDHAADVGELVSKGRRDEFKSFMAFQDPEVRAQIPDPQHIDTFRRSKLDWAEREHEPHRRIVDLYREMLRLRREDPVLGFASRASLHCEARGAHVLVVTRSRGSERRTLLVNLGETDCEMALVDAVTPPLIESRSEAWSKRRLGKVSAAIFRSDVGEDLERIDAERSPINGPVA